MRTLAHKTAEYDNMMINVNGSSFRLEAVPQHVIDAYGDCELSDGTGPGVIRVSEDIIG